MIKILFLVGMVLLAVAICMVQDYIFEKFGVETANNIIVFITGGPVILGLVWMFLTCLGL